MKVLLIFALAGSFFLQPTGSLKCYTCNNELSNKNCNTTKDCETSAKACKTDVIAVAQVINIITKECSASCESSLSNFTVGKRNISCCSTDLCNVSGAHSFRTSYGPVVLAVFTSLACLFLKGSL
ncbi:Prostate stem cell antigen [Varanus komodoensis]|uniref:prostate stem cell antigen-like n=1 Tax=Varanus komodoensis TaxID=61221 RepID=UPI001CF7C6A6|nr:prostate stem cell antigen-like [Varanus komodoensis]KAF7237178.1 Prostate stem cell antigen [Varanus komodoensis]